MMICKSRVTTIRSHVAPRRLESRSRLTFGIAASIVITTNGWQMEMRGERDLEAAINRKSDETRTACLTLNDGWNTLYGGNNNNNNNMCSGHITIPQKRNRLSRSKHRIIRTLNAYTKRFPRVSAERRANTSTYHANFEISSEIFLIAFHSTSRAETRWETWDRFFIRAAKRSTTK